MRTIRGDFQLQRSGIAGRFVMLGVSLRFSGRKSASGDFSGQKRSFEVNMFMTNLNHWYLLPSVQCKPWFSGFLCDTLSVCLKLCGC